MMSLGIEKSNSNSCSVGIVDTGELFTAGYHAYVLGICEKYPLPVSSIVFVDMYTVYDYIRLSGMIATDKQSLLTNKRKGYIVSHSQKSWYSICYAKQ